jgi:hypothetical protein
MKKVGEAILCVLKIIFYILFGLIRLFIVGTADGIEESLKDDENLGKKVRHIYIVICILLVSVLLIAVLFTLGCAVLLFSSVIIPLICVVAYHVFGIAFVLFSHLLGKTAIKEHTAVSISLFIIMAIVAGVVFVGSFILLDYALVGEEVINAFVIICSVLSLATAIYICVYLFLHRNIEKKMCVQAPKISDNTKGIIFAIVLWVFIIGFIAVSIIVLSNSESEEKNNNNYNNYNYQEPPKAPEFPQISLPDFDFTMPEKIPSANTAQKYYVGNSKSKKYHLPSCDYLPTDNRFSFPRENLYIYRADGYTPCKHCNP